MIDCGSFAHRLALAGSPFRPNPTAEKMPNNDDSTESLPITLPVFLFAWQKQQDRLHLSRIEFRENDVSTEDHRRRHG
jgi:hypothetical protein